MIRLGVAILALVTYLSLPTRNYYWDGVSFAQTIEDAVSWPSLLHPNHLIYNMIGWVSYKLSPGTFRALNVLQVLDSVFAALAVWSIFGILKSTLRSVRSALLLTLLFAAAGTWWRFATDADAYIASTTLLTVCASVLTKEGDRHLTLAAVLHAAAMLVHQLAILFLPAALFAVWHQGEKESFAKKLSGALRYLATTGLLTLITYLLGFTALSGLHDLRAFLSWATSHAEDSAFSFSLGRNLIVSARSWLQLFLVGRPSLVHYREPTTILLLLLCSAALALFLFTFRRQLPIRVRIWNPKLFRFSLLWLTAYAGFLLFWLPNNTFYKLFALPAVVLLIASCWPPDRPAEETKPAMALVVAMALFNFTFAIVPYSRVTANEAVAFAMDLRREALMSGDVVYFSNFNTDNWLLRYFNPNTIWKRVESTPAIDADLLGGNRVWLETTAIDRLSSTTPEWFSGRGMNVDRHELVNAHHRIRLVRLTLPRPLDGIDARSRSK